MTDRDELADFVWNGIGWRVGEAGDYAMSSEYYDRLMALAEAALAAEPAGPDAGIAVYESVLRGLRSEDDSQQLRAIISSVEADRDLYVTARRDVRPAGLDADVEHAGRRPMTDRDVRVAALFDAIGWSGSVRYHPEDGRYSTYRPISEGIVSGDIDHPDWQALADRVAAALAAEPAGLDAAWAEAEAALPDKRWSISITGNWEDGWEAEYSGSTIGRIGPDIKTNNSGWFHDPGDLPTPAAALRVLAAKLREKVDD